MNTMTRLSALITTMEITTVRRRAGLREMASAGGMASGGASRAKAANIDFSRGSAAWRIRSIWSRTNCWRAGRLICFSGTSITVAAVPVGAPVHAEAGSDETGQLSRSTITRAARVKQAVPREVGSQLSVLAAI